ncbi:M15 family metallopeptidase [Phenylobacterium sp.]|uniref:M15 family metallopeptidase n=1 Tax=Phenylobacterium sp. TaxID=1871053 RepID=UPI002E0EDF03
MALIGALIVWRVTSHGPNRPAPAAPPPLPPAPAARAEACGQTGWRDAATANDRSLSSLAWAPFGRAETGWETYAPLIAREIGTRCGPATAGFAAAWARWQAAHQLPADGIVKEGDFAPLRNAMALRRPFVQQTAKGLCPAAPADTALADAAPAESYGGKPIQLREGALAAYRRLVAAARAEGLVHGEVLKLVSGYRSPVEEAARCAQGGCNTLTRAHCSAHRTGLAMDLYLDHAPGQDPTSTDDANRAAMARTPAYRWLVLNADRFGFLPYPFEPWHWEWTGEPP